MKRSLSRVVAVLLTGAAVGLLVAADKADPIPPQSPAPPAPSWLKIIDQGDFNPRLKGYKTPEGVKVEIVAENPAVVTPVGLAFADDGTPYVLEWRPGPGDEAREKTETITYKDGSKRDVAVRTKRIRDVVKTLSDSKGKGVYDESKVVLEDELPAGLLLHDGWLYLCGPGAVRRYKQSKADGPYDVKEVVARGFGGFDHPASGMAVGPDGWLYLSAGDGDNVVEGADGGRAAVLRTGGVFRCRPDGSKMQTYAIGICAPGGGVAFDAAGCVFLADNDAADGKAAECRLLHVVEGADFGWRLKASARAAADPVRSTLSGERPGKLAPMLDAGRGSASGLLVYDETGFPENYRGLLLAADAARQSVHAYKVERKGATFGVAEAFDLLKSDDPLFRPCQATAGPDGAIYVVDSRADLSAAGKPWGDGEHGRIYRLTWAGTKDQPALPPRDMDSWAKLAKLADEDLMKALLDGDGGVREHARAELARRGEKERPALYKLLKDAEQPDLARAAALGALESMWNDDVQTLAGILLVRDSSADVRRLCADALGRNAAKGDEDVHSYLLRALTDAAPEVRRAAALAMSRVAAPGAPDNLVNTWSFEEGRDPYLRDGLVFAIENLSQPGVERLVALGESGVQKDIDKVVEAFTMLRTRPGADAIPRVLENPHLSAAQRAALIRSYNNYVLDPPVTPGPALDYLKDQNSPELLREAVKTLGADVEGARFVGRYFVDKKLPAEVRPLVIDALRRHADEDPECARTLADVMKDGAK